MSVQPTVVIERVVRVAPLGIRFFDPATGRHVSELVVRARPILRPAADPLPLFANPSGVFALNSGVPSVREFEISRATLGPDADFWSNFPAPAAYRLTVSDPLERFLPFTLTVDVPTLGLFVWHSGIGSPIEALEGQPVGDPPLFSAPWRATPEGMAVLRADLHDPIAQRAAAWAIVEVRYAGKLLGRGMASDGGQVVVFFPYPAPLGFLPESPPGGPPSPPGAGSLWEQTWPVAIRVAYAPASVAPPSGSVVDLGVAVAQLSAAPAAVWADVARTTLLDGATLRFGEDLILRSAPTSPPGGGGPGSAAPSRLLVTPVGSPP